VEGKAGMRLAGQSICFPTLEQNPYMVRSPGEPGLLFMLSWRAKNPTVNLFVRTKTAGWSNFGRYKSSECDPIDAAEWTAQSEAVKKKWLKAILGKKYPAAREMRARILLRKTHEREPSAAEVAEEVADETVLKSKARVSEAEVRAALASGEEHLRVYSLEFLDYDEDLQRYLIARHMSGPASHSPPKKKRRRGSDDEDEDTD